MLEILESIQDAFLGVDEDWKVICANGAAERLLGIRREHVVGHALFAAVPVVQGAEAHQKLERVIHERTPVSFDVAGLEPDTWYAAHAYPSLDGLSIHIHDVTDRRRAEEALRFLADAGPMLSGSLDRPELTQRAVRMCVPRLSDWCTAILSESSTARAYPEASAAQGPEAEQALQRLEREYADNVGWGELLRRLDEQPDESLLGPFLSTSADDILIVPITGGATRFGALVAGRLPGRRPWGSEERHAAESLGRRLGMAIENAEVYAAARRATRLRDDVLGIVAHDLRSSLNAITMSASAMELQADSATSPVQAKATEAILRSADRMSRLIGDLLDAARLEADWTPQESVPVAADALLESAVEPFRDRARASGIRLEAEASTTDEVWVDEGRMLQALSNLVDNACKYTPEGGTVRVLADRIAGELMLSVVDSGPGIPPHMRPHLFDRFWQAKDAGRAGAGLGLFIAKRVVEGHGGRIWAESEVGLGSAFRVVLPLRTGAGVEIRP